MVEPCPLCGADMGDDAWLHFHEVHAAPGQASPRRPSASRMPAPSGMPAPSHSSATPAGDAPPQTMGGIWRQGVAESPVTMTILAVTIGLWILHVVLKAVFHLDTDATLAGNGRLGTDGQWWRLITPVVVHFGLVHLAFNMAWLYQLGPPIERVMGRAPFAVTYAATGVAGNIASDWYYYGQNVRSGGASGAIYGLGGVLVGAYVAASFLKRRHPGPPRPGTLRFNDQMVRSLAILFGVYLVFGTLLHVDSAAHAGGGVLGLAVGGVVAWRRNRPAKVVAS